MADDFTDHYGLQRLSANDISLNSYKFAEEDRDTEDALLYVGAEGHHHTGVAAAANTPAAGPSLQILAGTGFVPSSTRVYYKITNVDVYGVESAASPEVYIDTPAGITAPGIPTVGYATIGGALPPGPYFYALSAYQNFNSLESLVGDARYVTIPYLTNTNANTITLPALPSGASGFNIYRKGPSSVAYRYLASVDMTAATPPSNYIDDGSIGETQSRPLPNVNTTVVRNSVIVTTPSPIAATPTVPVGYTWRVYRTYVAGDYTNSRLTTVQATYTYIDVGASTTVGQPPTRGYAIGTPSKIDLTAEVQNTLPTANGGTGVSTGVPLYSDIQIGNLLTTGEETIPRLACVSDAVAITTSATLRLTYFTARKTETVSNLAMATGSVGAGSGATPVAPTRCQMCVFSVAANGDLTLLAVTTNDTTLFSATYTRYQKAVSGATPFTKTRGVRYAFGVLVVTLGSIPTFLGTTIGNSINFGAIGGEIPVMSRSKAGQASVPSTITNASLVNDSRMFYGEILP